jgi:SAM-dependent methyltransferase
LRIERPERRLSQFFGRVDYKHNVVVASRIEHGPVLDLGCGYGTLTESLAEAGLQCVGVDIDEDALAIARRRSPGCRFERADAADLPFGHSTFATVVLRDSLHHLLNEGEWPAIASEIRRVLAHDGRIVILDPNVVPIVRASRAIVRHADEVCSADRAVATFEALGFSLAEPKYNTVFSLPLSGGYVGVNLVPPWRWLHHLLLRAEAVVERILDRVGLLRHCAWRYLLVADRRD